MRDAVELEGELSRRVVDVRQTVDGRSDFVRPWVGVRLEPHVDTPAGIGRIGGSPRVPRQVVRVRPAGSEEVAATPAGHLDHPAIEADGHVAALVQGTEREPAAQRPTLDLEGFPLREIDDGPVFPGVPDARKARDAGGPLAQPVQARDGQESVGVGTATLVRLVPSGPLLGEGLGHRSPSRTGPLQHASRRPSRARGGKRGVTRCHASSRSRPRSSPALPGPDPGRVSATRGRDFEASGFLGHSTGRERGGVTMTPRGAALRPRLCPRGLGGTVGLAAGGTRRGGNPPCRSASTSPSPWTGPAGTRLRGASPRPGPPS